MKIEKLPSGSYRIRKMYKGKSYQIVTDYKPTQKEAIQMMAEELGTARKRKSEMTFREAAAEYIENKRNVLSPSTIKGYKGALSSFSDRFLEKNVNDITRVDIQKEVNVLASGHAPKTVRNYHGFISAVMSMFCPDLKINTTLPQKIKNDPYIPSDEDVRKLLDAAKGTKYEIAIILACYGMRRSEICALTPEDVDGDVVHINKALVLNENNEWVIKTTKTTDSTRDIVIPIEICEKIKKQGYVYKGSPNSIGNFLTKEQKRLNIPLFSLHKLRHYFASKMSAIHVPDENIIKMGGWRTDHVMKNVYRHAMQDKELKMQREASQKMRNSIFNVNP